MDRPRPDKPIPGLVVGKFSLHLPTSSSISLPTHLHLLEIQNRFWRVQILRASFASGILVQFTHSVSGTCRPKDCVSFAVVELLEPIFL